MVVTTESITHDIDEDLPPSQLLYTFGGAEAVAEIAPGTIVHTMTRDCFAGLVRSTAHLPSQVCDPRYLNPQTGPFHITGAKPGDTLAVHFASIEPRHGFGVSSTVPFFGALTASRDTALLHPALPELTWIYDLDTTARLVQYRAVHSRRELALPMDPMHGTVGVAPPLGEVRSSLAPGNWGGNMDTPEMRSGTTCYLGVNVAGGLLSLGDGHARQGEGESCGVAVECAMQTSLVVDLIPDLMTPWPRLENDDYLMTTGSAKPLEDAFRIAQVEMVRWIAKLLDLDEMDAYQLVAQVALTPVANVCDTVYTVVCKVAKAHLGAPAVYGGLHARLRNIAKAAT